MVDQLLPPLERARLYRFPDGCRIVQTNFGKSKWVAYWADNTPLMGEHEPDLSKESISYFDTPEEPARIMLEAGEGPASLGPIPRPYKVHYELTRDDLFAGYRTFDAASLKVEHIKTLTKQQVATATSIVLVDNDGMRTVLKDRFYALASPPDH
jgi:hypothetical protein